MSDHEDDSSDSSSEVSNDSPLKHENSVVFVHPPIPSYQDLVKTLAVNWGGSPGVYLYNAAEVTLELGQAEEQHNFADLLAPLLTSSPNGRTRHVFRTQPSVARNKYGELKGRVIWRLTPEQAFDVDNAYVSSVSVLSVHNPSGRAIGVTKQTKQIALNPNSKDKEHLVDETHGVLWRAGSFQVPFTYFTKSTRAYDVPKVIWTNAPPTLNADEDDDEEANNEETKYEVLDKPWLLFSSSSASMSGDRLAFHETSANKAQVECTSTSFGRTLYPSYSSSMHDFMQVLSNLVQRAVAEMLSLSDLVVPDPKHTNQRPPKYGLSENQRCLTVSELQMCNDHLKFDYPIPQKNEERFSPHNVTFLFDHLLARKHPAVTLSDNCYTCEFAQVWAMVEGLVHKCHERRSNQHASKLSSHLLKITVGAPADPVKKSVGAGAGGATATSAAGAPQTQAPPLLTLLITFAPLTPCPPAPKFVTTPAAAAAAGEAPSENGMNTTHEGKQDEKALEEAENDDEDEDHPHESNPSGSRKKRKSTAASASRCLLSASRALSMAQLVELVRAGRATGGAGGSGREVVV